MTPTMPDRFTGSNAFEPCPADSEALIDRFMHDARFLNARAMHAAVERFWPARTSRPPERPGRAADAYSWAGASIRRRLR